MNPSYPSLLSIILQSYQSESKLEHAVAEIISTMEKEDIPFEIIIIDDGSWDRSFRIALKLEKSDSRVRAYQLSRNYTTPYAQFAGMAMAKGGCAVSVPDDLTKAPRPGGQNVSGLGRWSQGGDRLSGIQG